MGPPRGLGPEDQTLYLAIDEVLHYIWDRIGVASVPQARDEYTGYVLPVLKLLRGGASASQVSAHLQVLSEDGMGIGCLRERADEAASTLIGWFRWVNEGRS